MRCICCNEIIDEMFIKISGQDELCEDCLSEVNKQIYYIPIPEQETISIEEIIDKEYLTSE